MTGDMPMIAASAYGSGTQVFQLANNGVVQNAMGGVSQLGGLAQQNFKQQFLEEAKLIPVKAKQEITVMSASRRLVQVFIADPDENVPLDQSLLYTGEQKLTDATDQELFFEIDIRSILEKHNAVRITLINKKVKERTENLEPAKIRDLKMVVVNVATF